MIEAVVVLMALAMGLHVWRTERALRRLGRESDAHERGLYEIGSGVQEALTGRTSRPAGYRVSASESAPRFSARRVYCVDCRFKAQGVSASSVCIAQPDATDGRPGYWVIGLPQTNKNHDCVHYQEKKK